MESVRGLSIIRERWGLEIMDRCDSAPISLFDFEHLTDDQLQTSSASSALCLHHKTCTASPAPHIAWSNSFSSLDATSAPSRASLRKTYPMYDPSSLTTRIITVPPSPLFPFSHSSPPSPFSMSKLSKLSPSSACFSTPPAHHIGPPLSITFVCGRLALKALAIRLSSRFSTSSMIPLAPALPFRSITPSSTPSSSALAAGGRQQSLVASPPSRPLLSPTSTISGQIRALMK